MITDILNLLVLFFDRNIDRINKVLQYLIAIIFAIDIVLTAINIYHGRY